MTPSEALAAYEAELAKHHKRGALLDASTDWKHKHWSQISGMMDELKPILATHVARVTKKVVA